MTLPRIGSCPICRASVRIDLAVTIECPKCGFRPRDLWKKTRGEDGKVTLGLKTPPGDDPSPIDK